MKNERFGLIKFRGRDQTVIGEDVKVGETAPDFIIQKTDWLMSRGLKNA